MQWQNSGDEIMGEYLFTQFVEERIEDIHLALVVDGIYGILRAFEDWLQERELLK